MHRVHIAIILAAATISSASPVLSQGASQPGQPCPDNSATVRSGKHAGNSAGNAASEQGVEHSAILPSKLKRIMKRQRAYSALPTMGGACSRGRTSIESKRRSASRRRLGLPLA